jgi:hypothetical protein
MNITKNRCFSDKLFGGAPDRVMRKKVHIWLGSKSDTVNDTVKRNKIS